MAPVPGRRVAVLVATFSRPSSSSLLKVIVDRERPDFDRLVPGSGPSFPSGHVMAAIALWGMLPLVASLYTRRRDVVVGVGRRRGHVVGGIAASRVYLGVHWFSDVIGGLAWPRHLPAGGAGAATTGTHPGCRHRDPWSTAAAPRDEPAVPRPSVA